MKLSEHKQRDSYETLTIKNSVEVMKVPYFEPTTIEGCVKAGKTLMAGVQCHQALIAYLALKACSIRHGGISNGIYTLTNYSEDVGIPLKTLSRWTLIYRRVIVHLGINPSDISKNDWNKAAKISNLERGIKKAENVNNGVKGKKYKDHEQKTVRSPEEIRKAFNNMDEISVASEVVSWNSEVGKIRNKLVVRDLNLVDKNVLLELMNQFDFMGDFINNYLTKASKRVSMDCKREVLQ